jgi:ankyrin repeat protein
VLQLLRAIAEQDGPRALGIARDHPHLTRRSLHVAAALGAADDAGRLISANPGAIDEKAGDPSATPLLFLASSPLHGESPERDAGLLACARQLLDAGADPNAVDGRYGVPVLYGVTGMHNVPSIARLLLEAGAKPTDGESVFHAAEHFHAEALALLWEFGVQLNEVGEWGNTPLYFLLRWHDADREDMVGRGIAWLLDHGADPNVLCGKEQESSLHVSARRGQSARIVQALLDHGARVDLRRGDGATAWRLAGRGGHAEIVTLLERAGAKPERLTDVDELLAACGRGDAIAAGNLGSRAIVDALPPSDLLRLNEAAAAGRLAAVQAYISAGFPVTVANERGATALHEAAIRGYSDIVKALLAAGADPTVRDPEHDSTPMGWAMFGADFVADPEGDYEATVRALSG